jgi:cell division protein FtsX
VRFAGRRYIDGQTKTWVLALVAAVVVIMVAAGGMIMLARKMDQAAHEEAVASTGSADLKPNTRQQQEHAKSSRGTSNGSSITGGAVPPAGR